MTRMRAVLPAVVALGANQGDREATLREAVRDIAALDGVKVTAASGLFASSALKPSGIDESAPPYLNAVILLDSALGPEELLFALHEIEAKHGRIREEVWGDRTLDLDIVSFASMTKQTETITLPHPRAFERAFVLAPWLQVEPDAVIAGRGRIADLLATTSDTAELVEAPPLLESAR
jgi:2-amino-4-hydroxy-6-hydroxymethyldihydropteridine diphosphokinase